MKYFFILFLMLIGALAYFRDTDPITWNHYLDKLRAPDKTASTAPTDDATPADATASDSSEPSAPAKTKPVVPEIISNTVLMNPDHTRPVDQPAGNAAPTNAPSTNAATGNPQ